MSSYLGAFLTVFPEALTTNISDNTSANSKIISSIFLNKPKTSVLGLVLVLSIWSDQQAWGGPDAEVYWDILMAVSQFYNELCLHY